MKDLNRVRNLTGQKFGRLTVLGIDDSKDTRKTFWICECECGNIISTRSDRLTRDGVKSCGCYKREQSTINVSKNHTHKQSGKRLYHIWQGIKARCYNSHNSRYDRYGGRVIVVCDEWKNDFAKFFEWAMSNGYSENLTIDRIDNDKNYEPDNCRWADTETQCNNRGTNINITIGNATKTLTQWCEIFELKYTTVIARYHANGFISIDELFNKN